MKSKPTTIIAGITVLALLLMGAAPVMASSNPPPQTTQASALIQLAQAAQTYAQQVLAIAQKQGVNVANGTSLINQGDQLLTSAQSVLSTNSTQAAKDALGAMKDFRAAVNSLQSEVVVSVEIANQVQNLQTDLQRIQNRTNQFQTTVNKLCSNKNASASTCADANKNLGLASTDLTNAASQLKAITSTSTEAQIKAISSLLQDAQTNLQQVSTDINSLANDARSQQAITYVQNTLDPRVTQIQQQAQKANITSSQRTTILGQLGQAQSLLTSAVQSFQAGNFNTGVGQVNQATGLMLQALGEIQQDSGH
jgi:cellobiose-specific phosphotransferase system component IIA